MSRLLQVIDFPVVFLDEASMATEPASLMPLVKGVSCGIDVEFGKNFDRTVLMLLSANQIVCPCSDHRGSQAATSCHHQPEGKTRGSGFEFV